MLAGNEPAAEPASKVEPAPALARQDAGSQAETATVDPGPDKAGPVYGPPAPQGYGFAGGTIGSPAPSGTAAPSGPKPGSAPGGSAPRGGPPPGMPPRR